MIAWVFMEFNSTRMLVTEMKRYLKNARQTQTVPMSVFSSTSNECINIITTEIEPSKSLTLSCDKHIIVPTAIYRLSVQSAYNPSSLFKFTNV